jgi:hypothetical protein
MKIKSEFCLTTASVDCKVPRILVCLVYSQMNLS